MVISDQEHQSALAVTGASSDYAIELLTFAATEDYAKANLQPSAEQFELVTHLVNRGLLKGEFVRDGSGVLTGILVGSITENGVRFLADLKAQKNPALPGWSASAVLHWLEVQFIHPKSGG